MARTSDAAHRIRNLWILARPASNVKNVALVLLALYFAGTEASWTRIALTILSLSCAWSALYVFNALEDRKCDRENQAKAHFAHAVEAVGSTATRRLIFILGACAFFLGAFINFRFLAVLIFTLLVGFMYSAAPFRFKDRPYLDVIFGGVFTYPLRFLGGWVAFSIAPPPMLPLVMLASAKGGGYLFYKEFDRAALTRQGVRNTTTIHAQWATIAAAFTLFFLAISSWFVMIANASFGIAGLGALPAETLLLVPFLIPPLVVSLLKLFGVKPWRQSLLRRLGLFYFFLVAVAAYWTLL